MEQLAENILSWCKNLEPAAMQQVQNLSNHPCLVGNVCLMPDAHCGYGMPIGGVVALDNAISPNMVGVDIGCGMLAVQTSLTDITREKVQAIVDKIYERVPVGFEHHKEAQENPLFQDLAFLPIGTREAGDYINEMKLCLDFAFENRKMIATAIKKVFTEEFPQVEFVQEINIHHNYAAVEEHYNRKVWVHRKGATLATANTTGIIPGSQGTSSYIVQGLGNEMSLQSCSHGAGRCMSRSRAMKDLDLAHEQEILNSQGIVHRMNEQALLDEAPSAYKNIGEVMENQKDLVKILVKLSPLGVVKASNEPPFWRKKAKKDK